MGLVNRRCITYITWLAKCHFGQGVLLRNQSVSTKVFKTQDDRISVKPQAHFHTDTQKEEMPVLQKCIHHALHSSLPHFHRLDKPSVGLTWYFWGKVISTQSAPRQVTFAGCKTEAKRPLRSSYAVTFIMLQWFLLCKTKENIFPACFVALVLVSQHAPQPLRALHAAEALVSGE